MKLKRYLINNQIRAEKVRVIDEQGKQLGVFSLEGALKIAKEKNLDLILISEKADPPVCKIADYGKFLYQEKKKEKKEKKSEVKEIRLSFNISDHDMETRANQAEKFLKAGDKLKIQMILHGREKVLADFAKEKFKKFIEILQKKVEIKIEQDLKKTPGGFIMIVAKK